VSTADDLPPSERPTPIESSAVVRAEAFGRMAAELAAKFDLIAYEAAKVGTTDIQRGVEARRLAGRARGMVAVFAAWERGEATREQRAEDHAAWRILVADGKEFERKPARFKVTSTRLASLKLGR
jgi:hypothetical protein